MEQQVHSWNRVRGLRFKQIIFMSLKQCYVLHITAFRKRIEFNRNVNEPLGIVLQFATQKLLSQTVLRISIVAVPNAAVESTVLHRLFLASFINVIISNNGKWEQISSLKKKLRSLRYYASRKRAIIVSCYSRLYSWTNGAKINQQWKQNSIQQLELLIHSFLITLGYKMAGQELTLSPHFFYQTFVQKQTCFET